MGCTSSKGAATVDLFGVATVPEGCLKLYDAGLRPMEAKFKMAEMGFPLLERPYFFSMQPDAEGQLLVELIVRAQRLRAHLFVVHKMQEEAGSSKMTLLSGAWVSDLSSAHELDMDTLLDQVYFDNVQSRGAKAFPNVTDSTLQEVDAFITRDVERFMQVFSDNRQVKQAKQTISELLEKEKDRLNRQGHAI
mmetsp:Transcript_36256/g.85063  ORF Transcript_36256/g.85063 Transcript_36256/m.85063 type:complete len:192 (-) Transcript_36256:204-779(-)